MNKRKQNKLRTKHVVRHHKKNARSKQNEEKTLKRAYIKYAHRISAARL